MFYAGRVRHHEVNAMESIIIGIAGGSGSGKEPKPVILVEGILLLADERIRDLLDIKVYVEADADERILRRILRDVEERGRNLHGIIDQYLATVKPMHYMYVEPTRAKADIVINSGKNDVAFDLFVSKIIQLLDEIEQ